MQIVLNKDDVINAVTAFVGSQLSGSVGLVIAFPDDMPASITLNEGGVSETPSEPKKVIRKKAPNKPKKVTTISKEELATLEDETDMQNSESPHILEEEISVVETKAPGKKRMFGQ